MTNPNDDCIVYNARRFARIVTGIYNGYLRKSGITVNQFNLLHAIKFDGVESQTEFASCLQLDRSGLNRCLKYLIGQEYVAQVFRKTNRKEKGYSLTASGEDALKKAIPFWQAAQKRILKVIDKDLLGAIKKGGEACLTKE